MTWSLSASGHTPAPEGESGWEKVEKKLYDELKAVLSKPEYGVGTSWFGSNHVSGQLHENPAQDAAGE